MNIAILGYGTIGSGVHQIVEEGATLLTKSLHVTRILIRKGKEKTLPYMCDDIEDIVNDPAVDLVVETMGGIEPAHTYILKALEHGKHVVTANKAVVAAYLKDFNECAKENKVKFYYEASTGGGIPCIAGLEKALRIDDVDEIHGIFNGTSNFILDHMQRYGTSFEEVLKEAQRLGYAEADPSADIDGYDVCNKLRISASIAYDYHVPDDFPVFGIRNITKEDVMYFKSMNRSVRFIAKTKRDQDRYSCVVEPILFNVSDLEANTQDNYNLISMHGKTIGDLKFYGQGAGKLATANAVVQDILDILEGKEHMERKFENKMKYDTTICRRDYVLRADKACRVYFKGIKYETSTFDKYMLIKDIEVMKMHELMKKVLEVDPTAFMASIYEREDL